MKVTIVSGSPNLDLSLLEQLEQDFLIGVDRGAYRLAKHGIHFNLAVGDFDSIDHKQYTMMEVYCDDIVTFNAVKDETDTELAIRLAIEKGAKRIQLIGVTGHRLDHFLGTLNLYHRMIEQGVDLYIYDSYNRIYLLEPGKKTLQKGTYRYISFFSYGGVVTGLTLKGFKYPLTDFTLDNQNSLTISNEIIAEQAVVEFNHGQLLVVESNDA